MIQNHALIQWQNAADNDADPTDTTNPTGKADDQARVDRVLRMDPSGSVLVIDVFDKQALPRVLQRRALEEALALGDVVILERDPYQELRVPDEVLAEQFARPPSTRSWESSSRSRDWRWCRISEIITALDGVFFDNTLLRELVQRARAQTGCTAQQLESYLRAYWQRGECKNALLPQFGRCGAKGQRRRTGTAKRGRPRKAVSLTDAPPGLNVDERVKTYFKRGTSLYYDQRDRRSVVRVFDQILQRFFNIGYEVLDGHRTPILAPPEQRPTLRQYRYWLAHEWDPVRSNQRREGLRRHNLRYRATLSSLTASFQLPAPGLQFQIDATIGDFYLVSQIERQIIGRPVIYLITDVFSTLITGFSVGLEGPSWVGAMLALENMALPKRTYCAEYGVNIDEADWPCHSFPRTLCGDRGEMLSRFADQLAAAFYIRVATTAAYRADWKGLVEREFGLVNEGCIIWIPGHSNGWHERGERDHRLDACMSLREFRRYLIDFILEYNTTHHVSDEHLDGTMIRDDVPPYPRDLWLWGIANRSGILRDEPRDVVRRNLLPRDTARVTKEGIRFRRLHYTGTRAEKEQWFERAAVRGGSWSVPTLYDPRSPAYIYLVLNEGRDLEACRLLPRDQAFAACEWADIEHSRALRLVDTQAREASAFQTRTKHQTRREDYVTEARERTNAARQARGHESNAERLRGTQERRQAEKRRDRAEHRWQLDSAATLQAQEPLPGSTPGSADNGLREIAVDDLAYQQEMLALLRPIGTTEDTADAKEDTANAEDA